MFRNSSLKYGIVVFLFGILIPNKLNAQDLGPEITKIIEQPRYARLLFYNCENLFDYFDDTLKNDEEFLPEGDRGWNKYKYYTKLNRISKVITAAGAWKPIELVGLCEIENARTLYDLTKNTPLYLQEYRFIHKESADKRGIDVALLYQPKAFTPLQNAFLKINFGADTNKTTRDILYSKGVLHRTDTLHVFVNHWPSRWGGELESEEYRIMAAQTLRIKIDSIFLKNPKSNIIIMGDFNDTPTNSSIIGSLNAKTDTSTIINCELYNLSVITSKKANLGTHKYQGNWMILDQMIVSGNLINGMQALQTSINGYTILNADFLMEKDDAYLGFKPFRTYLGFKYNDGYSDHLPVFIDLNKTK